MIISILKQVFHISLKKTVKVKTPHEFIHTGHMVVFISDSSLEPKFMKVQLLHPSLKNSY